MVRKQISEWLGISVIHSDWIPIRLEFNPSELEPIRGLFPNQFEKRIISRLIKSDQKSNRLNPIQFVASIRVNPNQVFNPNQSVASFLIDLNQVLYQYQSEVGMIRIWFGLNRNQSEWIGLSQIDFFSFLIKRNTKRPLGWFGIAPNGSETDFGITLIRSDWIQ